MHPNPPALPLPFTSPPFVLLLHCLCLSFPLHRTETPAKKIWLRRYKVIISTTSYEAAIIESSKLCLYIEDMAQRVSSFWGPITYPDWCEKNYAYVPYIAEFFNTLSNIPCILLALIGLSNALRQRFEKRFSVLHLSNMVLAIGSMLYHATLQDMRQLGDETPMVWEMLLYFYILYSPDWHYRSTMPTFLFIYGAAFAFFHALFRFGIGFKIHYVILSLLCLPRMYKYYIHTKDKSAKGLAKLYLGTMFLGSLCWILDRLFCGTVSQWHFNPQGHALCHILMGLNSCFANTFLMFCRAEQLGWNPKVVCFMGFFPYVMIQKPKTQ